MPVYIGGAELNVATALTAWKIPSRYLTVLPAPYLSDEITAYLSEKKIDTSYIIRCGERLGTYYLPQGADMKNAGVIYDRANSSFTSLQPGMINWHKALQGCTWFHFSAISPALNENVAAVCLEGLQAATQLGLTISIDLNYRSKLWQYGKTPVEVVPELVSYCNVIMGNLWAVEQLLGIPSPISDSTDKTTDELKAAAVESIEAVQKRFPLSATIAYTFRLKNNYWAILQHNKELCISPTFSMENAIDQVGSGDCFMGGIIYGLTHKHTAQHIIDFAAAAAVGKLQERGDATQQTAESINERIGNTASH